MEFVQAFLEEPGSCYTKKGDREKKKILLGLVLVSSVFLGLGILLFGIGMFE